MADIIFEGRREAEPTEYSKVYDIYNENLNLATGTSDGRAKVGTAETWVLLAILTTSKSWCQLIFTALPSTLRGGWCNLRDSARRYAQPILGKSMARSGQKDRQKQVMYLEVLRNLKSATIAPSIRLRILNQDFQKSQKLDGVPKYKSMVNIDELQ